MRFGPRPPSIRNPGLNMTAFGTWQQSIGSAYPAILPLILQGQQVTGLPEKFPGQKEWHCPEGYVKREGHCVPDRPGPVPAIAANPGHRHWGNPNGYTTVHRSRQRNGCCGCGDEFGQSAIAMPAYQERPIDYRNATDRYGYTTYGGDDPYSVWPWNVRNAQPYGNGQYGLQYSNMVQKGPSLPAAQPGTWPTYAPMSQTPCATMKAYGVQVPPQQFPPSVLPEGFVTNTQVMPSAPVGNPGPSLPSPAPPVPPSLQVSPHQVLVVNTNRSARRGVAIRMAGVR